jgi:hypothetical protein
MCSVNLDGIKASRSGSLGCGGKGMDDRFDVRVCHLSTNGLGPGLQNGWPYRLKPTQPGRRTDAGMGNLHCDLTAQCVNGSGHFDQAVYEIVGIDAELPSACLSFTAYVSMAGDDQSDAALCQSVGHIDKPRRGRTVFAGQPFPCG